MEHELLSLSAVALPSIRQPADAPASRCWHRQRPEPRPTASPFRADGDCHTRRADHRVSSSTACRCTSSAGTCLVSRAPQPQRPAACCAHRSPCRLHGSLPHPPVLCAAPRARPRSDVSLIEYIRALDEQLPPAERFIITPKGGPLDDTHLLVRVGAPLCPLGSSPWPSLWGSAAVCCLGRHRRGCRARCACAMPWGGAALGPGACAFHARRASPAELRTCPLAWLPAWLPPAAGLQGAVGAGEGFGVAAEPEVRAQA